MSGIPINVALLHGAGYVGGELIRLLLGHPNVRLQAVSSETFAEQPVWSAHPHLRDQTALSFCRGDQIDFTRIDVVLLASPHGASVHKVASLIDGGYDGLIVDLSADFRYRNPDAYKRWFGFDHPRPDLLSSFTYGLPEIVGPYPTRTKHIANPGCFATALAIALHPVAKNGSANRGYVTALTGASGSGAKPTPATHFPSRHGNVRAYKVFAHQHVPEVKPFLGGEIDIHFVPVSGPWVRGIWGTVQFSGPTIPSRKDLEDWYTDAYGDSPLVRLSPGVLPELRGVVGTPFCDVGWVVDGGAVVIGFTLDNLLKGAASQAIQNLNIALGLPETAGLLHASQQAAAVHA